MEIVELYNDSEYLDKFYELYQIIFSDNDESEIKENIQQYLSRKNSNSSTTNHYHIFCLKEEESIVGFIIGNYYSDPNSGVIEYVAVKPEYRDKGHATHLIDYFTKAIKKDAGKDINGIYCVVDVKAMKDLKTPDLTLLNLWRNCGYKVVELNYVWPAPARGKKPVADPVLMYKDLKDGGLHVYSLRSFVKSYMKYAMSIEFPAEKDEFKLLENHLKSRTKVSLLPVDKYIKVGLNHFENPVIDYVATFPVIPFGNSIEDLEELSRDEAIDLSKKIKSILEKSEYFDLASIRVQKGDGCIVWAAENNHESILDMRGRRDNLYNSNYLKARLSIKCVPEPKKTFSFLTELPSGSVLSSKVQIWIDIDHIRMASIHFIVYYDGLYSTREIISLTDVNNVSVPYGKPGYKLESFANEIASLIRGRKEKSITQQATVSEDNTPSNPDEEIKCTDKHQNIVFELYPLLLATTCGDFERIKAHIYAVSNQDTSYEYAHIRYVKKFFEEDQSVLDTVYVHYGIKLGVVIFSEYKPELFRAVTDYDVSELEAKYPEKFIDPVKITIINEYITEITSLLYERLYLERLKNILSGGDSNEKKNETETLKSLTELQKNFYKELEEFRGLTLYSYTEVDLALKQARKDMGIINELDTMNTGIGTVSKKAELLYHIRNDFHTVLLSYLLTLFTAATFTVAFIDLFLPSAPIFVKALLILILPITAISVLYVFTIKQRE